MILAHILDIWVTHSFTNEPFYLPKYQAEAFKEEVAKATSLFPPSFCGLVRNPHTKHNS